jgi:hypothetical protein
MVQPATIAPEAEVDAARRMTEVIAVFVNLVIHLYLLLEAEPRGSYTRQL